MSLKNRIRMKEESVDLFQKHFWFLVDGKGKRDKYLVQGGVELQLLKNEEVKE